MSKLIACVAAILCLAAGSVSADVFTRKPLPNVDLRDVPLEDALKYVAAESNLIIVPDWNALELAGVTRQSAVTVNLPRASTQTVLRFMLRSVPKNEPLTAYVADGIVRVTTQAEADRDLVVRVYDVRDLLVEIPNFGVIGGNNGGGGFGGGGGNGNNNNNGREERTEDLIDLITSTIRPDVWDINGGQSSIRVFRGNLVVNAPRSVHAQL
jgi:hypothetical protein